MKLGRKQPSRNYYYTARSVNRHNNAICIGCHFLTKTIMIKSNKLILH